MSCVRFELESFGNCKSIGHAFEDPTKDRSFYGLACTEVSAILDYPLHTIAFTPKLKDTPANPFHTDIYEEQPEPAEAGKAHSAAANFKKESFKLIWKPYPNRKTDSKELIQPFRMKELIDTIKNYKY